MKKLLLLLIIAITLFSCTKETPASQIVQQSANGSIEFKVNGNFVVMDNVDLLTGQYVIFQKQLKGSVIPNTRYTLNAQKGVNNILLLTIASDSLQNQNYHYDSAAAYGNSSLSVTALIVNYNGQLSAIYFNSDYVDINISSYANGRISGTFTGKLTPSVSAGVLGVHGSTIITEGKINNVQVIY